MNKLLGLGLLFIGLNAHAVTNSHADIMHIFAGAAATVGNLLQGDGNVFNSVTPKAARVPRVVEATYNFTTQGGAVGAIPLGVTIPAGSVIYGSTLEVVTAVVSTNNDGTLAFSCEDANNIFTATDIDGTAAGGVIVGTATTVPVGNIAADCTVTATIAVHAFTAGKVNVFVNYVPGG